MSSTVPLERQLAAVRDEITKRRSLYPKWVAQGRMTQHEAEDRIACMQAVRETLERLRDEAREQWQPKLL